MKKLLVAIALLLLAATGYVAYVLLSLDPDELGQRLLGRVNEKTGVEMTATKFEVKPLQGVRLEEARLEGDLESGHVTGDLDRMVLDYELLRILQGEVVVRRVLVEGPDLRIVSRRIEETTEGKGESADPAGDASESGIEPGPQGIESGSRSVSAVSIAEIRVTDGSLTVTTEGSDSGGLGIQGFGLELGDLSLDSSAASPLLGFAARGGVRIDEIRLDEMKIRGGRGDLVLDRGRLSVTEIGIETVNASLEVAEIAADLTQNPAPYRLRAGGSYDLNALVEAEGEGFGPAALEFSAQGSGPSLEHMVAEGTFRLENGQVPAFPMMVTIERLLGSSLIVGSAYEGTDVVFSIADTKALIEPFVMGSESLQVAGAGEIDFAGPLDIQIDIKLPRELVSISLLDPFIDGMTDEEGWTVIPFNITGTMAEPEVEFDMTSVKDTASDLGRHALGKALDAAAESLKTSRHPKVPSDSSP